MTPDSIELAETGGFDLLRPCVSSLAMQSTQNLLPVSAVQKGTATEATATAGGTHIHVEFAPCKGRVLKSCQNTAANMLITILHTYMFNAARKGYNAVGMIAI